MSGYIGTTPVPQATQHREAFTANAGQTTFATAGYTVGYIDVWVNGVKLAAADVTVTNGSDIVLASAAAANDIIEYLAFVPFEAVNQTFTGATVINSLNLNSEGATVTGIKDEDNMASNDANKLATQQSIKAYVDSTVAATNEVVEDTTPQLGGDLASNGNDILMADNDKVKFGTEDDLQIYHSGSNSDIGITNTHTGRIRNITNNEEFITFTPNNNVTLYYNGSPKLATTNTGIDVTGTVTADGINSSGNFAFTTADGMSISAKETVAIIIDNDDNDSSRAFQVLSGGSGSTETLILASEDAGVTLYYDNAAKLATSANGVSITGNATFADNGKAIFGAGSDLQIYYDGTDGYIKNHVGGRIITRARTDLLFQTSASDGGADDAIKALQNGAVELYYDNAKKLATTSTGIQVTGNIANTSGDLTLDADDDIILDAGNGYVKLGTNGSAAYISTTVGHLIFQNNNTTGNIQFKTNNSTPLQLELNGQATFADNIQMNNGKHIQIGISTSNPFSSGNAILSATDGVATLDATGDIILDSDSGNWRFKDNGTSILEIGRDSNTSVGLYSAVADMDILFKGNDGGSTVTALTLDMSNAGRANFNNDIGLNDGRVLRLGNGDDTSIYNDGSHFNIVNTTANHDIMFKGNDDGSNITALTLDMGDAGAATFNGTITSKSHVVTGTDNNAFEVKTNHSGNPSAIRVAGSGSINGVNGSFQNFFVLNVMKDSGSQKSLYAAGDIKTDGNITIGTSGKGINFGATSDGPTMASELLDDYEEGTWTASMTDTGGSALTMVARSCRYTKIGRTVHIYGILQTTSLASASGSLRVHGLPFTSASSWDDTAGVHISLGSGLNITAGETVTGWVHPNQSYFNLHIWNTGVGTSYMQTGEWSADGQVFFNGHYSVS